MKPIALAVFALVLLATNLIIGEADEAPLPYSPSKHQIMVKAAMEFRASYEKLYIVAKCESSLNENAWNKTDPNGGSKGIFQFQTPTFLQGAKEIGITNPDIWSVEQQSRVAAYLFSQKKTSLWSCARKHGI